MPPRPSNGVPRKVADFATPRVWWFISPVAAYSVAQAGAGCQGGGTPREVLPKSWTKVMRQSHFEFCIGQDLTHSIFL